MINNDTERNFSSPKGRKISKCQSGDVPLEWNSYSKEMTKSDRESREKSSLTDSNF